MMLTYRFGRFELRPATRQLLVDEQPAALGARAFDLLLALIERRDRLVTKDELLELVWPGLVVEENNLQVQVSALRKLLGQDAIATVAGHGYRFTLEPTQVDAPQPSPAPVAKHNLPAPVSSFIGRERDLIDLRAMLAHHRLVTLTGVGGHRQDAPGAAARRRACWTRTPTVSGSWTSRRCPIRASLPMRSRQRSGSGKSPAGRSARHCSRSSPIGRSCLSSTIASICCLRARNWRGTSCMPVAKITILATSREPLHVSGEATLPWRHCPRPIQQAISLPTR